MSEILHSKIMGTGTPLLILHGFLGMSDNWKTVGNQFAENGFEVHLIDQRNHGKSFHSPDFNYDFLSDDLEHYMNHHNMEKAMLIGHSMGGKTVMQFACDHPDMTEKLIVVDISPRYYPPHHQYILNGLNALDFGKIKSRGEADLELSKHIDEYGIRQFLLKNLFWVENGKLGFRFNLSILSEKMEEIGEGIRTSSTYNGPTLFLKGGKSEYVSDSDILVIRQHFPQAELDTIVNAGHWVHAENPKQFLQKSLKFLSS